MTAINTSDAEWEHEHVVPRVVQRQLEQVLHEAAGSPSCTFSLVLSVRHCPKEGAEHPLCVHHVLAHASRDRGLDTSGLAMPGRPDDSATVQPVQLQPLRGHLSAPPVPEPLAELDAAAQVTMHVPPFHPCPQQLRAVATSGIAATQITLAFE
eukprot:4241772-Pyramimonas_sp.AAC.1